MEKGESSTPKPPQDEVWAKLIPTDSRYSEIELRLKETIICSEIKNSSSRKQAWCKITRNVDLDSAMMQNRSSKEILVDETVVQEECAAVIKCGSEISLGPSDEGYVKYRFEIMPTEESRRYIQISLDVEYAKCCICLNIWHDVVTAAPCLHNFCNGCFSEWLRRSQERRSSILCPHCRAVVHFVGRNHFLHNIEEDILITDPSLKRSSEDIVLLDSTASIKSPLVLSSRKSRRKREHSPSDAADSWEHSCPQCGNCIIPQSRCYLQFGN